MTPLRRTLATGLAVAGTVLAAVFAIVLTAVMPGPAVAGSADERCLDRSSIPASALTGGASFGCSLVGRTVYAGRVAVVVPPPGVTVAGEGVGTRGEVVGLTVANTGAQVRATIGHRTHLSGAGARAADDPCTDRTFHLEGHRWTRTYRYGINLSKAPARLSKQTLTRQIQVANVNMRKGRNTCGLKRLGTPLAHYSGHTTASPDIKVSAHRIRCGAFDRTNVIGFGNLPRNLLGWTCYWWLGDKHMGAADMMLDSGTHLVTKVPAGCTDKWDFEGTVTHEFGHVYGLAHSGSAHPALTMDHNETPCSTYARTLGLGDWLGMKQMYGLR